MDNESQLLVIDELVEFKKKKLVEVQDFKKKSKTTLEKYVEYTSIYKG